MAFRRRLEEGSGCSLLIWGPWDIVQCTKTVDSDSDTCQEILIDIWGVIIGNWLVPRGSNRLWQTRIVAISYYGCMVQLRYGTSLWHDKYIYMHIIVSVSKKADDVKISMRHSQSLFNKLLRLSLVVGPQMAAMTTGFHFLRPLGRSQRLPPSPNLRYATFKLGMVTVCPEI